MFLSCKQTKVKYIEKILILLILSFLMSSFSSFAMEGILRTTFVVISWLIPTSVVTVTIKMYTNKLARSLYYYLLFNVRRWHVCVCLCALHSYQVHFNSFSLVHVRSCSQVLNTNFSVVKHFDWVNFSCMLCIKESTCTPGQGSSTLFTEVGRSSVKLKF